MAKVQTTWLQCTLPKNDWDELNRRRMALKLTWGEVIIPGTFNYLAGLEAKVAGEGAEKVTEKPKGKGKRARKAAKEEQPAT
jgi:hypothetical protein